MAKFRGHYTKRARRTYRAKRPAKKKRVVRKRAAATVRAGRRVISAQQSRKRKATKHLLHDSSRGKRTRVTTNYARKGTLVMKGGRSQLTNPFGKRVILKTPEFRATHQLVHTRQGTGTFATLVNDVIDDILPGSWAGEAITALNTQEIAVSCNTIQLMCPANPWLGEGVELRDVNLLNGFHPTIAKLYDWAICVGCDVEYQVYNPYDEHAYLYYAVEGPQLTQPNHAKVFDKLPGVVFKGAAYAWHSNSNFFKLRQVVGSDDAAVNSTHPVQMNDAWAYQKTGVKIKRKLIAPKSFCKVNVSWNLPKWLNVERMLRHDGDGDQFTAGNIGWYAYNIHTQQDGTTAGKNNITPPLIEVSTAANIQDLQTGPMAYFWVAPVVHQDQLSITQQEIERHDTEGQTTTANSRDPYMRRYTASSKYRYAVEYISPDKQRINATGGVTSAVDRPGDMEIANTQFIVGDLS